MPGRRAGQLCPELVFVGGYFNEYQRLGDAAIGVLSDFTDAIERISIDEAFADVAGCTHLFGSPAEIARTVRARLRAELGLPMSIGVARTKHVAKIASQVAKPDGLVVVDLCPSRSCGAWAPPPRRGSPRSASPPSVTWRKALLRPWSGSRGGKKVDGTRVEPRSAAHPDAPARALCRRTIGARPTAGDRACLQTDAPSSRRPHRRAAPCQIPGGPDDHSPRALRRFALGHALAHAVSADFCHESSLRSPRTWCAASLRITVTRGRFRCRRSPSHISKRMQSCNWICRSGLLTKGAVLAQKKAWRDRA